MARWLDASHVLIAALIALASAAFVATPASAEGSGTWSGLWGGAGGAYSSTKADCRDCGDAPEYVDTNTYWLRGGYTLTPEVRVGVELERTERPSGGLDQRLNTYSALVQWKITPQIPLIIDVGYGLARGRFTAESGGVVSDIRRNGFSFLLGLGTEWPIGPVNIGPHGAMRVGALGDVETQGAVFRDVLVVSWSAGVNVSLP
jgi:opacity protein-like surface antigen